jgi:hypothetical protein
VVVIYIEFSESFVNPMSNQPSQRKTLMTKKGIEEETRSWQTVRCGCLFILAITFSTRYLLIGAQIGALISREPSILISKLSAVARRRGSGETFSEK